MTNPNATAEERVRAALELLAAQGPGVDLPGAHQVFWRARVLERFAARREAEARAARPLDVVRWVAAVLVALVAAAASARLLLWATAQSALGALGAATGDPSAAPGAAALGLLLAVGVALLATALAAGLYGLVREP